MIVGWQLATHLRTDLVLDALEMANGLRQPDEGLIAHTDRGSQYTSIRYTDRLDELGAAPSVGSRGDAYDNAMAEAWVATFKSELVDGRRFPSYERLASPPRSGARGECSWRRNADHARAPIHGRYRGTARRARDRGGRPDHPSDRRHGATPLAGW